MRFTDDVDELREIARQLRIDILTTLAEAGSGHTGGSLSAIDIITVLYFSKMNHSPSYDKTVDRDRFVLSKGHGAPALYVALAHCGYFDRKELKTLRKINSILSGHPYAPSTPGVEVSTGSLGQGLSIANGMALAGKMDNRRGYVYCLIGDGEMQEGQVWEAAMSSAHYKLDNVIAFTDNNGLQIDGRVKDIMGIEPVHEKWEAFGWDTVTIDGHDIKAILDAIERAKTISGKPSMICARTVKGKGVSFMEGKVKYHGVAPSPEELEKAIAELAPA